MLTGPLAHLTGFQIKVQNNPAGASVTAVAEYQDVEGRGYQGEPRYRAGSDLLKAIAEAVHDAGKAPILQRRAD